MIRCLDKIILEEPMIALVSIFVVGLDVITHLQPPVPLFRHTEVTRTTNPTRDSM